MIYCTDPRGLNSIFKYVIKGFIYTLYIYCICGVLDIHKLPIRFKRHAALRLIHRFDMSIEELRHILKTGKQVKIANTKGNIGIIERKIGRKKIRIKLKIIKFG